MNENFQKAADEAAAFQRIWTETMTKMMQTAFTVSPGSPPPDIVRQMRSGIFQALAQSWDEFMRSPQFLDGMRQMMENAISFRKLTNDFMARVRTELQAPSRDDIDSMMLTVRHMEKRLLDRMDRLAAQVNNMAGENGQEPKGKVKAAKPSPRPRTVTRTVRRKRTRPGVVEPL